MSRWAPRASPALLDACERGDADAFGALFESYEARVRSMALHFTADAELARDVTQQVFVTVLAGVRTFRRDAQFDTWLFRIVANACFREHRRRRRFVPLEGAGPDRRSTSTHEHEYLRREQVRALRRAIRSLPPKLQRPLLLRHVEGLSYQQLSAVLGCSTGTVASRLNRARGSLASMLASTEPCGTGSASL